MKAYPYKIPYIGFKIQKKITAASTNCNGSVPEERQNLPSGDKIFPGIYRKIIVFCHTAEISRAPCPGLAKNVLYRSLTQFKKTV
jgi:hypothetical protein